MVKKLFLLSCLLFAANSFGRDWTAELSRQVRPFWPAGSKIRAGFLGQPPSVPEKAELFLNTQNSYLGLVPVEWRWSENGTEKKKFGTASIQVKAKVAVAKSPLGNQQALDEQRVEFVEHDVSALAQQGFFLNKSELERRKVRGYVAPGAVLNARNTTLPLLVERGQMVRLMQDAGALSLSAQMESLESGALGEWVRVSHPKSRKVVRARIVGVGEVAFN